MRRTFAVRLLAPLAFTAVLPMAALSPASATPAVSMDVATGDVLFQEDATQPWFPASTTKLMTVYVALSAIRDHQITMDTPLVVSARAHKMPPSKMGFPVGTQVTLGNALKMLMVRSANDIAITVAEGIAGSVEAFADDMNQSAAQLGMRESHFVNPNGLPDPAHVSSARDMAILARAIYTQFPDEAGLFNLGELSLGSERIPNHNNLLGRYPGADGMKTGFTCAAGFNVVASAYRDGRRVVVVVFGAPSVPMRTEKAAALFDRAFAGIDRPGASIIALPESGSTTAPDMRDQVCRARGRLVATFTSEVADLDAPLMATPAPSLGLGALNPERSLLFNPGAFGASSSTLQGSVGAGPTALRIRSMPTPVFDPVPIHIGAEPGYTGVVAEARAPHTPIGSGTAPVTAEAYAASQPAHAGVLGVDPDALPLRGRRVKPVHRGRAGMSAASEAPTTKVLAGKEGEDGADGAKTPPEMPREGRPKTVKASKSVKTDGAKKAATKDLPRKAAKGSADKSVKPAAKKTVKSAAGE